MPENRIPGARVTQKRSRAGVRPTEPRYGSVRPTPAYAFTRSTESSHPLRECLSIREIGRRRLSASQGDPPRLDDDDPPRYRPPPAGSKLVLCLGLYLRATATRTLLAHSRSVRQQAQGRLI